MADSQPAIDLYNSKMRTKWTRGWWIFVDNGGVGSGGDVDEDFISHWLALDQRKILLTANVLTFCICGRC